MTVKLEQGDIVLADQWFIVEEDVALHGARLKSLLFTRGKQQLSQREFEISQQLSAVRIHVISLLKNNYSILQGPLPVCLLKYIGHVANIDKILVVRSALTNLTRSIVAYKH